MPDSWMCAHEGSTDISSEATAALDKLRFSESPVDKLAQRQAAKDASAGAAADSHEAAEHETLGVQVPFCLPVDQAGMESGNHLCRTLNLMLLVLDPCDETGGSFQRKFSCVSCFRVCLYCQRSTGRHAAKSYAV